MDNVIDALIVWTIFAVPISVICWAVETRKQRKIARIEGPVYDWANWAIDLTEGLR